MVEPSSPPARIHMEDTNDEVCEEAMRPYEGMKFQSIDDAFIFYNSYAKMRGFGIRKGAQIYNINHNIIKKTFLSVKEGQKRLDDPREVDKDVKRRSDVRDGCLARMVIKIDKEGEWIVNIFEDKHSHAMEIPSKVRNIRSHKQLSEVSKQIIHGLAECGVGPSKISRVLNHVSDGVTDGEYTPHDCRNQLAKSRQNNMGQQFLKVHQYFQLKVGNEEGFFFKMQVDENCSVRSVFWADMRSRQAYMQFGDVLVFDVTYNTNSFKMPFAPFTGVNHHRQSTLFGCALLADETKDTFRWLFQTWLECMWGKAPQCIITDQDGAIKDAISNVFPHARHRFCSWHIAMNGKNHLRELAKHDDFKKDYHSWRFAETPEKCEDQWKKLREKYLIEDGSWLHQMYMIREHWLNAYLKDWFFAGMSSSQRSESINAFFDGYVNSQTSVTEFVTQYEKALNARRQAESLEDYQTMQNKAAMHIGDPMEQMARQVYTRKVFVLFREEYKHALLYSCHEIEEEEEWKSVYKLARKDAPEKYELVSFSASPTISMACTCKKFKGDGILCRHVLRLMLQKDMDTIPEKYILSRWTIGARYASSSTLQTEASQLPNVTPYMLFTLKSAMSKISNAITTSPTFWNHGMPLLKNIIDDFDRMSQSHVVGYVEHVPEKLSTIPPSLTPGIVLIDPPMVKRKGRPKGSARLKSGMEMSQSSQSRGRGRRHGGDANQNSEGQRHCGNCGKRGHYSTTCTENRGKPSPPISNKRQFNDISENEEEVDLSDFE